MVAESEMIISNENAGYKFAKVFENVVCDDFDPYPIEEGTRIGDMFLLIKNQLDNFDKYLFIVHDSDTSCDPGSADTPDWLLPFSDKKKVLIWINSEHKYSQLNKLKDMYHHIFANYMWDTEHVTSIPLGCYANSQSEPLPMEERMLDITFVGCLNRNRLQMACNLIKVPYYLMCLLSYKNEARTVGFFNHMAKWLHPKDLFGFTSDFGRGVDTESYTNILNSSKVSLCPKGWINTETYRLYESMRAGCVTISNRLPNRKYYKDIPTFQVDNWREGLKLARKLISNGDLDALGKANKNYYDKYLSPQATANIIVDKLNELAQEHVNG